MKIFNTLKFLLEFKQLPTEAFDLRHFVDEKLIEDAKALARNHPDRTLRRSEFGTFGVYNRPMFDFQLNMIYWVEGSEFRSEIISVVIFDNRKEANTAMLIAARILHHVTSLPKI